MVFTSKFNINDLIKSKDSTYMGKVTCIDAKVNKEGETYFDYIVVANNSSATIDENDAELLEKYVEVVVSRFTEDEIPF